MSITSTIPKKRILVDGQSYMITIIKESINEWKNQSMSGENGQGLN